MRILAVMTKSARDLRDDAGVVAVVVAVLAVAILGFAALAVDIGLVYAKRQAYAAGADSASLAVARAQWTNLVAMPAGTTCAELRTADAALADDNPAKAANLAVAAVNVNAPFGSVLDKTAVNTALTCVGPTSGALVATVSIATDEPTLFGQALDRASMVVTREASSALAVANNISGSRPIALCNHQADQVSRTGSTNIALDKTWVDGADECGTGGQGNWGWVYCAGGGTSTLAQAVTSGCSTGIDVDTSTNPPTYSAQGTPGNKGSSSQVEAAMATIMDQESSLLVYDTVTDSGSNATYNIVGFLTVKFCGYRSTSTLITGACYDTGNALTTDHSLQVQWVAFTPAGEPNQECAIGDAACDFGTYVIRLVK